MRTRNYLPMNLQLFGGLDTDDDDTLIMDDTDDLDNTPEQDPPADDEGTEDHPADDKDGVDDTPESDPEPEKDKPEPLDTQEWVKRRLARAERAFERKFLEEAASESDGVQLERRELPKAVRLWNVLKHNPDVSRAVDELLRKSGEEGKLKPLTAVRPDARINRLESEFDLREAELELKYSDPVYRKYSEEIKDWAEAEGLDITNPKTLRLAVKAWKSDNQGKLLANKPKPKAAPAADPKRKAAALVGGKSPVKATPIDYRKASDADILKSMGISLFTEE